MIYLMFAGYSINNSRSGRHDIVRIDGGIKVISTQGA